MRWHELQYSWAHEGDRCFAAQSRGRTYSVVLCQGVASATWADATRGGPRLGSAELPIGASYPSMNSAVHALGEFSTIEAAKEACRLHTRSTTN